MRQGKCICVVIPAYNEAANVIDVIKQLPSDIDHVVVVDDGSTDRTAELLNAYALGESRLVVISHETNHGVGAAMASGYRQAMALNADVVLRVDGDGQMAASDMDTILAPVINGDVDAAKGNRLVSGEAFHTIPKVRYFGNAFLSMATKIASGYWHLADSQSGFIAINQKALVAVDWKAMYRGYGQPNDLLVRLNVANCSIRDVPVAPVYLPGGQSSMRVWKVIVPIAWLLIQRFFWRLTEKYVIRDFHPLVFFYALGGFFSVSTVLLFTRVFYHWWWIGHIPAINALAGFFSFMSASLFILFAMWFDMEANKSLNGNR